MKHSHSGGYPGLPALTGAGRLLQLQGLAVAEAEAGTGTAPS